MKKTTLPRLFSFTILLIISLSLSFVGCKNSPTEPSPGPTPVGQSALLLSRLSAAIVPGGTEMVTIYATNSDNVKENCTVSCDNPEIANVSLSDTVMTITGINYGTATVTVTSQSGNQRTMPVNVYNSRVLDTGELEIAYVDTFQFRGSYTSFKGPGSFWQPVSRDGFQALGSMALNYDSNPNGKEWMMVVKAKEGSDALAAPTSYSLIYQFPTFSVWRPNPPAGYVALGEVVATGFATPPPHNDVVCVKNDLAIAGQDSSFIWSVPSNAFFTQNYFTCWKISPYSTTDPVTYDQLATGTFLALGSASGDIPNTPPANDPTMYVLKVNLPVLSEAPPQTFQPTLEGYDTPPLQTPPTFSRSVLVPCTSIIDGKFGNVNLKIENSPFYVLEREVYYKYQVSFYNKTSQNQNNSLTITSGIDDATTNTYSTSTGVTISFNAGINVGSFSLGVGTTLSETFGYEHSTSITELHRKSVTASINVSPNKVAAVWQQYNRFVLYRQNGTKLEVVGTSCEFGIDSYVTDEYPHN